MVLPSSGNTCPYIQRADVKHKGARHLSRGSIMENTNQSRGMKQEDVPGIEEGEEWKGRNEKEEGSYIEDNSKGWKLLESPGI